ncbi:beta-galactosidase [Paenibacillus sedimenti]|uniref:Beta-galactosidase n=1 Tax=Paenibacillus sedimenti TaxID=2770274 RepID=A0A926KYS4_9BACL|nr:beta-galactosidase [Paenibacillus sedimenti]MBD0384425.1 beta-galactosidase [Paenibacillus sedimenti]
MSAVIELDKFICGPDSLLHIVGEEHIRIETSASGGGVGQDLASYDPGMWKDNEYLVADLFHESHDVLVVMFSFGDAGGKELTVHYGLLPNIRTRVCLPLKALNGEKLFLDRYPGVMQSVLRGDRSVDRTRLKSLSISTIPSVKSRSFEVSGLHLRKEAPDFTYKQEAYIDALGQLLGKEWSGKTGSIEQLSLDLKIQMERSRNSHYISPNYSRFGGWKGLQFEASGYFRTENDGERWWFVDPEGYVLFSAGMDCVQPYDHMRTAGMEHLLPELPDQEGKYRDAWSSRGFNFLVANLIRAFEENWLEAWMELTECHLKEWGINTIGNWSLPAFIQRSSLPYVYPMEGFPSTEKTIYRDFPDVFNPEYERNAQEFAGQLVPLNKDQRLVGYFMRNEPHWAFVDGLNLTEAMLEHPHTFDSKVEFVKWLEQKYTSIEELNGAWGANFKYFHELLDSQKASIRRVEGVRQEDYAAFNRILIRRYVEVPAQYCKKADPHHLNLGMRYAWIGSEEILEGCESFDVFSINCYQMQPDREHIEKISNYLKKPVMIGEFHFGAADAGLLAYGIRAVASQEERGLAYRYFVEQAAAIPELIGVHYFQLADQPVLGRFDGENYQIGVIDVCYRPYQAFVENMKQAHDRMYEIRIGTKQAYDLCPNEIPRTGF